MNRPQTIYYVMIANFVEAFRIVPHSKCFLSTFTSHIIVVVFFMEFLISQQNYKHKQVPNFNHSFPGFTFSFEAS